MAGRLLALLALASVCPAAPSAVSILKTRCVSCHSGHEAKSGLDLTTRERILRGGSRGAAIVAGNARASLLYKAITHQTAPHMPFSGPKLADEEIASIAKWIEEGALISGVIEAERHWSLRKVARPPVPATTYKNPADAYLEAERARRGLKPMPEADRRVLLRRVTLDLIGVPPTPAEISAFLDDRAPNAYEKVVDRLLADPRYGERWARHWMDVWRYSDWYGWRKGKDVRNSQRHLWRWRDWIVDSLNADKGYHQMVKEMLAGDEIAPNDPNVTRATGYLARNYSKYDRHGWMQDAVDHTAQAFLGVTLKCARCHDHKYDPFTQADYFRFRAIFEPYQVRYDRVPGELDTEKNGLARIYDADLAAETHLLIGGDIQNPDKERKLAPAVPAVFGHALAPSSIQLNREAYEPDSREFVHLDLLADARAEIAKADALPPSPLAEKSKAAAGAALAALEGRIAADKAKHSNASDADALAAVARTAERQAGILKAAETVLRAHQELEAAGTDEKKIAAAKKSIADASAALTQPAEGYTPIGKAYPERSSGRRLALAEWIASRDNPLTARVAVNHMWLRHFGRALVPTVSDFGKNGRPPSHPELLDWLAMELMDRGWSMKPLHRMMVTSVAYRMVSTSGAAEHPNARLDPDNVYLWRMNPRRMEAETVRDSILAVAGSLDPSRGGPEIDDAQSTRRRSLYIAHTPDISVPFLKMFDAPNPVECYERNESVIPQQALALANSKLSREEAEALAKRLAADGASFAERAFERILGRPPSAPEAAAAARFLATDSGTAHADLVHVLFNHNDFVTIR